MEDSFPLITVIIPTFNRGKELERALSSLTAQTFLNFEVVVCDDGSSEDIEGVVFKFSGLLDIRYLRIQNSGGPARPRNLAVKISRGKWLSFLDSDDWWDPDRLQVISRYLDDDGDLLYHQLRVACDDSNLGAREKRKIIGSQIKGDALRFMATLGNPIPTSSVVLKKTLYENLGGMCEDKILSGVEDFDFWLAVAHGEKKFIYIPYCLGYYWVGGDALSNFSNKQINSQEALYKKHVNKFKPAFKMEADSRQYYVLGTIFLKLGCVKKSAVNLLKAKNLATIELRYKRLAKLFFLLFLYLKSNFLLKWR